MGLAVVARTLRTCLGAAASKVSVRALPNWVVRLAARFVPDMRVVAADLGHVKRVDNGPARRVLGLDPRPQADAVAASGESLVAAGLA